MSDSPTVPGSPDPEEASRRGFYRVVGSDREFAARELLPVAMGTLRSLANINHGDQAQARAREALAQIDDAVMTKGKELGLWRG